MDETRIFSFLGSIVIGLLSLWMFGTLGGIIGAFAGWFIGSNIPKRFR